MSLNREKILNELGDVMNQLQGADCGCMGKLFTPSPAQGMQAIPGMGGCCSHPGCHSPQPMQSMPPVPTNANQVLGNCNPAQLYNETYSYLSENLVKPVVQEVYQDLKSLTPENTMANNPLAQQIIGANNSSVMGSPTGNPGMPMGQNSMGMSNPGMSVVEQMGGMVQSQMMGGQGGIADQMVGMGQNQMMAGDCSNVPISENVQQMGQEWVNMMLGDSKNNQAPAMPNMPAMASEIMGSGMLPMSGGTPPMPGDMPAMGTGIPPMGNGMSPMGSGIPPMASGTPSMPQNPHNHPLAHMSQMANMAQMPQNMMQSMEQKKPDEYGMQEFNKMFPEIQQGGDLGFDPMALAMQLNPDNQQKTAMDAIHNMTLGMGSSHQTHNNMNTANHNMNSKIPPSIMGARNGLMPQDQVTQNTWNHHQYHQGAVPQSQGQWPQQSNQPAPYAQQSTLQQQYEAAATAAGTVVPAAFRKEPATTMRQEKVAKEPIYPVDTSNIRYNTLGQPVELVPDRMIQRPNFPLPQTLSPMPPPVKPMKFGTVKSTISKTALMGMHPVGKQPSKSQLQQIYNQYRGSNSYPNIGGGMTPYKERTNQPLSPLENVGDIANAKEITVKVEPLVGDQGGDGPLMTKIIDEEEVLRTLPFGRSRNGLQDFTPTQYTSNRSPKWSFHGDMHTRPHYTTYRFKPKN